MALIFYSSAALTLFQSCKSTWRHIILLSLAVLLTSCSHQPVVKAPEPATKVEPPPFAEKPFAIDTLYELLAAEFAGIREEVKPALDIYIEQAHETRDPGVIERAIHIASFLRDGDAILDMARLWVDIEPDNIDVRRLLAFHLARTGQVLDAFPHGEYLLLNGDDDYLQSLAAFAQDAPEEEKLLLLSLYNDLESEHPENPGLLLGKAMLLRQLERLQESLDTTDKLIKVDKRNETGQLLRAQLFHAMGERKKALSALTNALKLLPESKRLRLQYARFLSDDDLSKSRNQIQILSDYYPDDANIRFSLGLANKELGLIEEARATFQHLVDTDQRSSDAQFQLGTIAEDMDQPEDAVYRYRQVKEGQNLLPAAMRASEILTEHDNLSAAREHLSSLRAIYPAIRENLFQMEAELLLRQQRHTEAYDLLTSALQEDPNNLNLLYARSIISTDQGDLDAAEADLRDIMAQKENNATALNALGYTLLNMSQRYDEAMKLISQAHELEPDNPAIMDSLGWAYFRLGQYDEALEYLRQAFEAFPDGEVAAHLGEVLWVTGRHEEALDAWQKGLKATPDNKTLKETLERLLPEAQKHIIQDDNIGEP